ncbi:MAG: hypothetical protein QM703_04155 [Gemmatales bacterium]
MLDQNRFHQLWQRLTDHQDSSSLFADLVNHYSQNDRYYHNDEHIKDCLRQFDFGRQLAIDSDMVELAIWFHDVIYDSKAKDNEEQSAVFCANALTRANVPHEVVQSASTLILITRHAEEPTTQDEKLIVDIDLSILGQEPEKFAQYERQIRLEYAWVPEEQFRVGRRAVLQGIFNRKSIYYTQLFQQRFELQARKNLVNSMSALQGSQ